MTGSFRKKFDRERSIDEIKKDIETGETVALSEFYRAVQDLVNNFDESNYDAEALAVDEAYRNAKEGLRKMAEAGVQLDQSDTRMGFVSLASLGGSIKEARVKYFKTLDGVPEVTGEASRHLASEYLKLLSHLKNRKVVGKRENGWLQGGLEADQPGGNKAGYDDAEEGVKKLEENIKQYDKDHKATKAEHAELKEEKAAETDEQKIERLSGVVKDKLEKVKEKREKIDELLSDIQTFAYLVRLDEVRKIKQLPTVDATSADSEESMHIELQSFLASKELKEMQEKTNQSKNEAHAAIEKSLLSIERSEKELAEKLGVKYNYSFEKLYKSLEPHLSKESKSIWDKRFSEKKVGDKSKKTGWGEYVYSYYDKEPINREALTTILTQEFKRRIDEINNKVKDISKISVQDDMRDLAKARKRVEQAKAQKQSQRSAIERAEDKFNQQVNHVEVTDHKATREAAQRFLVEKKAAVDLASIEKATELFAELNKLKPAVSHIAADASPEKIDETVERQETDREKILILKEVLYHAACQEASKVLQLFDLKKIGELRGTISEANSAMQKNDSKELQVRIEKLQGKPSGGKKFLGVLMMLAGAISRNDNLYKRGLIAFKSGYDLGKSLLVAGTAAASRLLQGGEQQKRLKKQKSDVVHAKEVNESRRHHRRSKTR